jgi:DHA3 family macrolide efflux protein-like MFS transporter
MVETQNWKVPFFTLWTGQAISLFGSQLVQFALVWWLTQKTGSATVLALATLVAILPNVLLGPIAGVLVDRWSRRQIMLVADSLVALATLILAVLFALNIAQVWHVYLAMLIRAMAGAFQFPAVQATASLMAPKEQLARIAGLNQTLQGLLGIAAPPVGALLLSALPLQGILAIDVGTALFGILPLLLIAIPQPPLTANAAAGERSSFAGELRAGLRYVLTWPGMLILLLMATVINFLLTPAASLMPILVTKHFSGQAWQYATLESVFGIGLIAGGILLGVWGGFKRRIYTALGGLIGLGLGFLLIGLTPTQAFWLALASAFLAAAMNALTNGPVMAIMQAVIAPDMQGRVFTLIGSVSAAMAPIGLLIAGPVADRLGVQSWYIIGGVVCALMGVAGFFIPAVVGLEDGRAAPDAVPAAIASGAAAD